jgi:hypothetical protein
MATTLFTQNTIACIWDFDKTLIPEYMQSPLFRRYGIDEPSFWGETNNLMEHYKRRGYHLSGEIAYLNHLLTYVLAGKMPKLSNKVLREAGGEIQFYPGLPHVLQHGQGLRPGTGSLYQTRDPPGALHRQHRPGGDGPRQRHRPVRGGHLGL